MTNLRITLLSLIICLCFFLNVSQSKQPVVSFWSNTVHNCKLKPDADKFKTRAGKPFNPADWFNDKKSIIKFYKANNYHNVILKSREVRNGRFISLFTDVYPGEKTFVEKIIVSGAGNKYINNVLSLIHCKPGNLWLFRKGIYDPDKFKDDIEKIQNFFINKGYLDVESSITISNSPNKNRVIICVNINRGPQYKFGKIIWNQQLLSTGEFKQLKDKLIFPENTVYTPKLVKQIRKIINKYCLTLSPLKPYLSVMPIISRNSEPTHPIVDIIITLRKNIVGVNYSGGGAATFSYPASLANEYLSR